MLNDAQKQITSTWEFPSVMFSLSVCLSLTIWSQMLIYGSEYTAWKDEEAGSHREEIRTIQQQRSRKELLSPCTAEAHVHIHWALKALGHSQRTGWHIQSPNSTQKATCSGKVHLRKHPGTGQGPAAGRNCYWSALSHWCASVQRPCKSSTKEPQIRKEE